MIEIEVSKENLEKFTQDLRKEDKEELEQTFKESWKRNFIDICLKEENIWFLADEKNNPCAIGGIQLENKEKNKPKKGRIWLICANNVRKNHIYLFRYIINKIKSFKEKCDILYNSIYKTNFGILKWLKKYGFKVIDINDKIKFFYFTKEENFDT